MRKRIVYISSMLMFVVLLAFLIILTPAGILLALIDPELFENVVLNHDI